jgi:hypothetical protein
MNRVFPNGDGRPKRATPAQVARVCAAVRAGDPAFCKAFAQQILARLDKGETIGPMKPAKG